jgi:histidinol-phosphatase (PHP family)
MAQPQQWVRNEEPILFYRVDDSPEKESLNMFRNHYPLADYHVHPDFSFDAVGTIDEYCRAAMQKGLSEICFTTHYDSNPILPERDRVIRLNGNLFPNSVERMKSYVEATYQANERYFPLGLAVKCGVEFGYYPGCEKEMAELFRTYRFDYRMGAVHEVDDINICYDEHMEKCRGRMKLEDLMDRYFELVRLAASSGLLDSIAHLDMYKKYGIKHFGEDILTAHRGRIEAVFEALVENGTGLEINTSAVRRGHSEYYPSMEIINMARAAGASIVAIGSDAHKPEDVAYDFEAAAAIAYELFPYCDE